ncbi:hypothetical protein A6C57_26950 (plasmid) [Fibrella sp. ES10-3-2-2]
MFTIVQKTVLVFLIGVISFYGLIGCSGSQQEVPLSLEQQNEQSSKSSVRLSGAYTCIKLALANGYTEERGQVKGQGYKVETVVKEDSVRFVLSGQGTAGTYTALDLGTYAVNYTATGTTNGGYFTIKKDILTDYNAVTVVNRTIAGTSGARQVTYTFPITLYQFVNGTPRSGQITVVKASDIFSTTQQIVGIFTFERTVSLTN